MNEDWTNKEVELIVYDYFNMLQFEIEQKAYNKTNHRRALTPLLNNRSEGSIEFKHQNISAVLIKMELPYIKGYKPRFNYQQILEKQVAGFINSHRINLETRFEQFSDAAIIKPLKEINFDLMLTDEPDASIVSESEPTYRPIKINYLEREQNNKNLGEEGEKLVIEYERYRLIKAGKENLADKIEWVSKDKGDGTGFDILSKNINGTDRFLEVKTTKLTKEAPIYLTKTEIGFAKLNPTDFYLYRVFNFNSNPQLFIKNGNYEDFCKLSPQTFKGYF